MILTLLVLAACQADLGPVDAVDRTGEVDLVVLTPAELAEAWQPFVEWKTARGTPTLLLTLDEVESSAQGVDQAARIKQRFAQEAEAGARGFILGADSPLLPHRTVNTWVDVEFEGQYLEVEVASDLYYADLDGDWDSNGDGVWATPSDEMDLIPEVVVARVPARRAEHVQDFTAKVMAFERWPVPDYQDRALLMGEWAGNYGGLDIYSSSAQESLILPLFPSDFEVTRLYELNEDYPDALPNNANQQRQAFEAGQSMALNFGHGNAGSLSNLDLSSLWDLDNVDRPMILATTECFGCAFAEELPVHAACEAFVLAPGGGVAYLGNTHWGIGFPSLMAYYMRFFEDLYGDDQPGLELGQRVVQAQVAYTDPACLLEEGHPDRWTALTMVLMGDPTVVPWQGALREVEVEQASDGDTLCFTARGQRPATGATMALLSEEGLQVGTTDATGRSCFEQPTSDWRLTLTGLDLVPVELEGS